MAQMDNQVPQNEDFLVPPPLGPELASEKWRVRVIDWRKVPDYRKEMAWNVIQTKFWFDNPSKRSMKSEVADLKSQMEGLKDKVDIVVDALQVLISNNQFQASTMGGSTKVNINLPQIISLLSQESTMGGSINFPQIISLLSQREL